MNHLSLIGYKIVPNPYGNDAVFWIQWDGSQGCRIINGVETFLTPHPTTYQNSKNKTNARRKQRYLSFPDAFGTHKGILVHHAVALAFIGPRPVEWLPPTPKIPSWHLHPYDCHHLNGITTDNRPENLIWLSQSAHRRFDAALAQGLILTLTDPLAAAAAEPSRDFDIFVERD